MTSTDHEQVKVEHPYYGTIKVDKGLERLLTRLWELDMDTLLSCQENASPDYPRPMVWIMFGMACYAEGFCNAIAPEFSNEPWSLYSRTRHSGHSDSWDYTPHLEDLHTSYGRDDLYWTEVPTKGRPEFVFAMSVRFPLEDLPAIHSALDI